MGLNFSSRRAALNARFVEIVERTLPFVLDEAIQAQFQTCRTEVNDTCFHKNNPWLTTLYFQGILAGEDAQTDARKNLLNVSNQATPRDAPPRYSLEAARKIADKLKCVCEAHPEGETASRRKELAQARDAMHIRRLDWLSDPTREALALEVDALGVLYDLCVALTYGMNRRRVGNVPALHVEGRLTRAGDRITPSPDDLASANMILDSLAVQAFLWFTGASRRGTSDVCDFEPIRRRVAHADSNEYIVGMVQNAVAAARGRELQMGRSTVTIKECLDAPLKEGDETTETTKLDLLTAPESDTAWVEQDRARFFARLIGTLSPKLYHYFKLLHEGTPKMKALAMIGAKSTHFVEREARWLISKLNEYEAEDFQELANLLKTICDKG